MKLLVTNSVQASLPFCMCKPFIALPTQHTTTPFPAPLSTLPCTTKHPTLHHQAPFITLSSHNSHNCTRQQCTIIRVSTSLHVQALHCPAHTAHNSTLPCTPKHPTLHHQAPFIALSSHNSHNCTRQQCTIIRVSTSLHVQALHYPAYTLHSSTLRCTPKHLTLHQQAPYLHHQAPFTALSSHNSHNCTRQKCTIIRVLTYSLAIKENYYVVQNFSCMGFRQGGELQLALLPMDILTQNQFIFKKFLSFS